MRNGVLQRIQRRQTARGTRVSAIVCDWLGTYMLWYCTVKLFDCHFKSVLITRVHFLISFIRYHIISYHIIPYHITPYHIIPYHIILLHSFTYFYIPYHISPYHIILLHTFTYHISPYLEILCCY